MLTYFFRAVFINLYFKTNHSNETFNLGFYSLSNVFFYRKHVSCKSNISVLTSSGKSRNIKITAPSTSPSPPPPRDFCIYLFLNNITFESHQRRKRKANKSKTIFFSMGYNKKFMFSAAVRGFHFYRRAWVPTESEKRECAHDKNNPFDDFAIKTIIVAMLLGICQWNFRKSQSFSLIEGQKWRHSHQQTIVDRY